MSLEQTVFGAAFQNPVLLASGTCGYGEELDAMFDIDQLGYTDARLQPHGEMTQQQADIWTKAIRTRR